MIEARSGTEAIEKASSLNPDVILLDLGMPKVTGLDVAKAVRQGSNEKRPVLIAHTSHSGPLHQQLAMDSGFDLMLMKPVHPEHLKNLLERFER